MVVKNAARYDPCTDCKTECDGLECKKLAEAEARIKDLEKYCCEVCHIRNVPSECENHCPVKIKRGRS